MMLAPTTSSATAWRQRRQQQHCRRPVATAAAVRRRSSVRASAASQDDAPAAAAAAPPPPPPPPDARALADARRAKRKQQSAGAGSSSSSSSSSSSGQQAVVQAGAAAAAGALPDVLAATLPDAFPTLSAARRVIRKDLVLVDGQLGSCKTQVASGQQLQVLEAVPRHKTPRAVSLEVALEDDFLAVVRKPWGVKMYGGDARRTVTGALSSPGMLRPSGLPDALPEPRPVHRLDAAVGGLLVVAKTAGAAASLSQQFKQRRVHKVYLALLSGRLVPGQAAAAAAAAGGSDAGGADSDGAAAALASSPSSPSPRFTQSDGDDDDEDGSSSGGGGQDAEDDDSQLPPLAELLQRQLQGAPPFSTTFSDPQRLVAAPVDDGEGAGPANAQQQQQLSLPALDGVHVVDLDLDGKQCYSLYKVVGYSRSSRWGGWVTTVALSPVTGRKHQLRRHMAALGTPIVGDGKYALSKADHIGNQGIYLESTEVWLTHPAKGQPLCVRGHEPARFDTLRVQQHSRWRKVSSGVKEEADVGAAGRPEA